MIIGKDPKRVCIYFIYDKDGIVDDYVIHQLKDLRNSVSFIHCVVNGNLTPEGKAKLSKVADEVYERENKGNDIGAYKAAISFIGWEKLRTFDELIIMNNTCFGPVYPFAELFDWAKERDNDFWGLTRYAKSDENAKKPYLHQNNNGLYYQSYFLVIRRSLLRSALLETFFAEIPDNTTYYESALYYEFAFPGYFEERGFRGDVFCDIDENDCYHMIFNPVRLLKEYRMPLFKKRSFFHNYSDVMVNTGGEATVRLIRYLEEETDYDMNLVWDSILRTNNLSDIVRCAHLNRVLPRDYQTNDKCSETKVGIIFHSYYEDLFDENISYINNFPEDAGVLVTANTEEKRKILEEKLGLLGRRAEVVVIENRGRDVSSLLVAGAEFVSRYDLVCFAHDKKTVQVSPQSVGRSWAYLLHENLYPTKEYVQNVIGLFEKESRLGIAFPPYPSHSVYETLGSGWTGNFENTKKILEAFDINVKIHDHSLCIAPLGTCFWFRPDALKKLFAGYSGDGWKYGDFPKEPNNIDHTILHAIERAYAYFAQDAGYYPAFLHNDKYAQIEFTTLEFYKTGSQNMRQWMDFLVMKSLGLPANEPASEGVNYGLKESLKHLFVAVKVKFPALWKMLYPARKAVKYAWSVVKRK